MVLSMSEFTVSVSDLIDDQFEFNLSNYPIFNEAYREGLNKKILDHYYLYEIGQETRDQFNFLLGVKMNEVMPYYNKLYLSEQLKYDPLLSISMETLSETIDSGTTKTSNASNSSNSTLTESRARNVGSDFPQTMLSGNGDYASNATDVASNGTSSGKASDAGESVGESAATGKVKNVSRGYSGSVVGLLQEYRESILNIDLMVIAALRELFMYVNSTGDSMIRGGVFNGAYYWNW